ncbi:hypothetical protein [Phenylobacterium sp.]|jgi:hypothetical protein|uniref:hypothetical protein n=1 Tax=Phenylobacterium sp. TaxID=1871053 RepID=UPI002E37C2A2|nr:hypothetical protein [Phenylobacterium sp.]HEX3366144.1 hypothetical protein [Phenylobacterium sp.]
MTAWLGYLLALAALIVLAPLIGWLGHQHARSIKGGVALASILLGFGVPMDPPSKHLIEAKESRVAGDDESGAPPDPDIARTKSSDG